MENVIDSFFLVIGGSSKRNPEPIWQLFVLSIENEEGRRTYLFTMWIETT